MQIRSLLLTLSLSCSLLPFTSASALSLGQVDSFEDGTTGGWLVGLLGAQHPAPPINVASGGPNGADDNYLRLTSVGGLGPGSKLAVINLTSWAGNYSSAGISAIALDLINLGSTDLRLRLSFQDPTVGPPTNVAFSTSPVALPSGSGWTRVEFPVTAGALTAAQGTVAAALSGTTALYLYHSDVAAPPGSLSPAVVAQLGVDNVTAVPEPGAALLIGLGLSALAGRRTPPR